MNSQARLTPKFVADSLGVYLPSLLSPDQDPTLLEAFTQVTTDSRSVEPGALFVAIRGEKLDGHNYISAALERGAKGILCQEGTPHSNFKAIRVFQVKDTLASFRKLAHDWRREFKIPVIAICGSVGKTTTKELLASVLKGKFPSVLKTEGSQNGYLGIPITLMGLRPSHNVAVIEVGIDEPGAMKEHMELVEPTHSIITALGPEHLEKLIDLETVAREESLSLTLPWQAGASVLWNFDEPLLMPLMKPVGPERVMGYTLLGKNEKPSKRAFPVLSGTYALDSNTLSLSLNDPKNEAPHFHGGALSVPLPGVHHARNLLGVVAIGVRLGLSLPELQKGLSTFQSAKGRTEIFEFTSPFPATFLCDYYNANPTSMEAAFQVTQTLSTLSQTHRTLLCLGDMLELGADEQKLHEDLKASIVQNKFDFVFLFGERMKWLKGALGSSFKGQVQHFETRAALAETLLTKLKPHDTVLIKGSRSMKMEEIWEQITHGTVSYRKRS